MTSDFCKKKKIYQKEKLSYIKSMLYLKSLKDLSLVNSARYIACALLKLWLNFLFCDISAF